MAFLDIDRGGDHHLRTHVLRSSTAQSARDSPGRAWRHAGRIPTVSRATGWIRREPPCIAGFDDIRGLRRSERSHGEFRISRLPSHRGPHAARSPQPQRHSGGDLGQPVLPGVDEIDGSPAMTTWDRSRSVRPAVVTCLAAAHHRSAHLAVSPFGILSDSHPRQCFT